MRADLHTHSIFSDGELIPAELVRRAMVLGHDVIAITDHVDMTNVEFVVKAVVKAVDLCEDYIRVIPGVEITHVPDIDILAHPGFITLEEAQTAKDNDIILEITGRMGHNITNGHVYKMAHEVGAKMVIDSDTHAPENLMDEAAALTVALGAGLTKEEADKALHVTPYEATKNL